MDQSERGGIVYLVGAGPGDPALLTLRGASLLRSADVVVYDHLASPRLLDFAPKAALRICAGKSIGHCQMPQDAIHRVLIEHARAGRQVVRLKGGDPNIFGRGAEEAEALRDAGVAFEVVPGVTAASGVSAYAGIPLTHRDVASAVAFVTGHDDPESTTGRLDWNALAQFPGTLVIYMGVTHLDRLCRTLIRFGKDDETPAALIESGTLPRQRTVVGTLADLAQKAAAAKFGPPGLCVIGAVVSLRPVLDWFESRPLFGQRIVVTRPLDTADRSSTTLETLGAEVLLAPTITIGPVEDFSAVDSAIDRLGTFDWLVFTSPHGVTHFLDRLEVTGRDLRALGHVKLAAIGPTTADALAEYHLRADVVPDDHRSEALVSSLLRYVAGKRVLLARADRGRAILKDELEHVADIEQVAVYRNADAVELPPHVVERIEEGSVDWITLTSPAITERLHALLPKSARDRIGETIPLASLSPVTSAAAEQLGWRVTVQAKKATWEGLVEAIVNETRERSRSPARSRTPPRE